MASVILLFCALISFVTSWVMIKLHDNLGIFVDDHNNKKPQRFHTYSVSRGGGIGIFLSSFLICFIWPTGFYLILAGTLAFFSGILEDFHNSLSPKIRLLIQIFAAILGMILLNATIFDLNLGVELNIVFASFFTIFAVVGCTNAINIIDGFNGLASGISIMVLASLSIASYLVNDVELMTISLAVIFSILGFFVLNFPKGKIFLGDGGAYFIGFIISQIAILLSQRHEEISSWFVLTIMIYPVYEVLFSAYRKKKLRNMSPMYPDGLHLHMLIYKRITRSNEKTSFFILCLAMPFIFIPIIYKGNTLLQIITIFVFVICYNKFYFRLIKFKNKNFF